MNELRSSDIERNSRRNHRVAERSLAEESLRFLSANCGSLVDFTETSLRLRTRHKRSCYDARTSNETRDGTIGQPNDQLVNSKPKHTSLQHVIPSRRMLLSHYRHLWSWSTVVLLDLNAQRLRNWSRSFSNGVYDGVPVGWCMSRSGHHNFRWKVSAISQHKSRQPRGLHGHLVEVANSHRRLLSHRFSPFKERHRWAAFYNFRWRISAISLLSQCKPRQPRGPHGHLVELASETQTFTKDSRLTVFTRLRSNLTQCKFYRY